MVRHLRLRQSLQYQGYTGKELRKAVAFEHKNWKEDGESLPTIEQARKMHETLGTWDMSVVWNSRDYNSGEMFNSIYVKGRTVYPKANYKRIGFVRSKYLLYLRQRAKEKAWKEQESRTLEFFEREGC